MQLWHLLTPKATLKDTKTHIQAILFYVHELTGAHVMVSNIDDTYKFKQSLIVSA